MTDSILLVGGATLVGSLLPLAWLPVSTAILALALLLWSRTSPKQRVVALLALLFGAVRASYAIHHYETERANVFRAFGSPALCRVHAVVSSSPVQLGERQSLRIIISHATCEPGHHVASGTVARIYAPMASPLHRGDTIELTAKLGLVELHRNFAADSALPFHARNQVTLSGGAKSVRVLQPAPSGWHRWIDAARAHARQRIHDSYVPGAIPLARALVLGENDIPPDDAEAFRISGLSHLLAVSGSHIVIAVLGLVRLLEAMMRRVEPIAARVDPGRLAAGLGLPLTWFYEGFAGSGGSVRRAALMTSAALLARTLARRPDGLRAFTLSLLVGVSFDPLAAYDASFGLSAGATAGLMLLSRPLESRLTTLPAPFRWVASPVSATISATFMCLPWLALLSPNLSVAGVFANVVAVPIGELVSLPACLVHLLLWWWPAAERGLALLGSGSLLAVQWVARQAAALTFLSVNVPSPSTWQLAVIGVGLAYMLVLRHRRTAVLLAVSLSLIALEGLARYDAHVGRNLTISVLDVGQGDSLLIRFPNGQHMLIDGGGVVGSPSNPGTRVVLPVLRARRISHVDVAVLTHPHPDHFIGLQAALPNLHVEEFWDTGQGELGNAGPIYTSLLHSLRQRHVPIRHPADLCNHPRSFGGAVVEVLAPCPGLAPGAPANDNSFVLRVSYGKHSALLVGDAEASEERRLLTQTPASLAADFLKAGHHGSDTSSTLPFVRAVHPRWAVLTCGARNRYGHPGNHSVSNLLNVGTTLFRSDLNGEVRWSTDGEHQWIDSVTGTPRRPTTALDHR